MFNIRFFEMRKLAKFLSANIDVFYVTKVDAVIGMKGGTSEHYRITELDELERTSDTYEKVFFIHVDPEKVCVFGDGCSDELKNIADLIESELSDFRIKRFSQSKAYEVLDDILGDDKESEVVPLANELTKEPDISEAEGYYGTIGECAFFRLVELGKAKLEDAYTDVFNI